MTIIAAALALLALQDRVSPDLLDYQPGGRLEGSFKPGPAGGFDVLLTRWAERLKEYHPDLRGGQVDSTLPPTPTAMIAGTSQFGLMSRRWTGVEVEDARFYWGYAPVEVVVGAQAIALVVHPSNPIKAILLDDVAPIFSATRRRGNGPVRTWGDLGVAGDWGARPINLYLPAKDSVLRTVFQERTLRGEQLQAGAREVPGDAALLAAVAEDPCAIGVVGAGIRSDHCRVVSLRVNADGPEVAPDGESILSLSYPLAWRIYLSVRKTPGVPLSPLVAEFVKMILSRDGQDIVAGEGMMPVTGRMAHRELKRLKLGG